MKTNKLKEKIYICNTDFPNLELETGDYFPTYRFTKEAIENAIKKGAIIEETLSQKTMKTNKLKEKKEHPIFKAKWVGQYVHLDEKSRKFYLWLKTDVKVVHIFTEDCKAFCIDLSMKPNQIEKEILERFDYDYSGVFLGRTEKFSEENKKDLKHFILSWLSTYRTQVEKENDINIKNAYLKGIADGRKQIGECCMGGCGNVNCKHCK